jgi:putative ATP-dependent endonuclease of OLD family
VALRRLRIERFRGIRSADVSFDATTVLIGENDCGRSSVLEALSLALSPLAAAVPHLEAWHFHHAAGGTEPRIEGPPRIELTLVESKAGSWDRPELAPLAAALGARSSRPRSLTLELGADDAPGAAPVRARWQIHGPGGALGSDDEEGLAAIRRMNPLVWLRGGSLVRAGGESAGAEPGEGDSEAAALLHDLAEFLRQDRGPRETVGSAGIETAERLLEEWAPGLRTRGPEVRSVVAEILEGSGRRRPAPVTPVRPPSQPAGSAAQQVGLSLVTAKLVHDLSRTSAPGVRPIIVLEDPEAHLHPMTLATVWSLIERFSSQKLVTTNSGALLAGVPLHALRRLVRDAQGDVREWRVRRGALRKEELRKVTYHLRSRRGTACFARCWLLVEGETEYWVLPDLARLLGHDLWQEGVACVEFAQCGLPPLLKLANCLGITWHVLADGDPAGDSYVAALRPLLAGRSLESACTQLQERDIEHCFWRHGHMRVFERLAGRRAGAHGQSPTRIIHKAIENHSKPGVAFELLASVAAASGPGPPPLRHAIETCVHLARDPQVVRPASKESAA